jgi:hypothetical protein
LRDFTPESNNIKGSFISFTLAAAAALQAPHANYSSSTTMKTDSSAVGTKVVSSRSFHR